MAASVPRHLCIYNDPTPASTGRAVRAGADPTLRTAVEHYTRTHSVWAELG